MKNILANSKTGGGQKLNKAFTLIELLAVIIILAVIALIATPIVLNVIENSRKESNKNSTYGILDAAKLYYTESMLDTTKTGIDGRTNLLDSIKLTGKRPDSGTLYISDSGLVAIAVVYDDYCFKKEFNEQDLTETTTDNCSVASSYIVTFDASGGSVSIPSKTVVYGSTYGDLPTPTRDGYTFKGWNGKNLSLINEMTIFSGHSDYLPQSTIAYVKENTDYIASWSKSRIDGVTIENYNLYSFSRISYFNDNDLIDSIGANYSHVTYLTGTANFEFKFKTPIGTNKIIFYFSNNNGDYNYNTLLNKMMIEEGSTATLYEPYYITNDTKVVQQNNHTLTAIWEENE